MPQVCPERPKDVAIVASFQTFLVACALLGLIFFARSTFGQLVLTGGGPGTIEPQIAAIDFAQLQMDQDARKQKQTEQERQRRQRLIDSGSVSALDLAAPGKAVHEFNEAVSLMHAQRSQDSIEHWQKAIANYPKFVSAYNGLGLAYLDLDNDTQAKNEFETAARLDGRFATPLLNLGRLALSQNDFTSAQSNFERAASLRPTDAAVLTSLAYAQDGNHQYRQAIATVIRVHELQHKGMGNAHYVAAAAALAINDRDTVERELTLFLTEDPANPLAPVARRNLEILANNANAVAMVAVSGARHAGGAATQTPTSLADSQRLKSELAALDNEPGGSCTNCAVVAEASAPSAEGATTADIPMSSSLPVDDAFTIRKVVDEVALFFAVSSHGQTVNDLSLSEIQVRDDAKPPEKILQFSPQSKLPLRVALLIDTSGSVQPRFAFEKYAASHFLQQLLTNSSDLAFVAGFSNAPLVTQDFTDQHEALGNGIAKLKNEGGTALFDAVSFASGKLAAYPEQERVARVLVILSDGEDNSSHTTLRRAIRDAENSGVTIYAISTKEFGVNKTAADRVLQELAERTGGESMFPGDTTTLHKSFDKLRDIIRSRYLIAYKPADFEANGKYRPIEVIAEKNGKRLQVHTRKGYRAPLAPAAPN